MTDKVQKIREEVERRMNCFKNERNTLLKASDNNLSLGARIAMCEEILSFIDSMQEEPVSEDFKQFEDTYLDKEKDEILCIYDRHAWLVDGANWQKKNLWKDAQGDNLPEYEREVVVFTQNYSDDAGIMSVAIGHRPNPDGWDGKSLTTGEVGHYTPKTYGKGGWNIPNIVYWLDVELPKEIEL